MRVTEWTLVAGVLTKVEHWKHFDITYRVRFEPGQSVNGNYILSRQRADEKENRVGAFRTEVEAKATADQMVSEMIDLWNQGRTSDQLPRGRQC